MLISSVLAIYASTLAAAFIVPLMTLAIVFQTIAIFALAASQNFT
jgi:hypothetical protein